nr:MAG: hypothetical protein 1 [Marnaviridae sp.]
MFSVRKWSKRTIGIARSMGFFEPPPAVSGDIGDDEIPYFNDMADIVEQQYTWTKCDLGHKVPMQRLQKQFRAKRKFELWKCEKELHFDTPFHLQAYQWPVVNFREVLGKHVDIKMLDTLESLLIFLLQCAKAKDQNDTLLAFWGFVKMVTKDSLIASQMDNFSTIYNVLIRPNLQADDGIQRALEAVTDMRSLLASWKTLKDSSFFQSIIKVYKFAISYGVFSAIGLRIDEETIAACKNDVEFDLKNDNLVVALLESISLVLQRGLIYMKTRQWSTLIHGAKSYGEWYEKCSEIKRNANFLGNLEVVETTYHEYVKDIKVAIEEGEAIIKYGNKASGFELKSVRGLLNDLKLIQASLFTYDEAQRSRRPPFALLVHGGSSVAKTTFTNMIFKFQSEVWDLPSEDAYKYVRDPAQPFWSGWNSSKWFIVLDDVAYINPSRPEVDQSLMEVIQIVNEVPMVPNQASLEDKGKNPVRARSVVATTNTKHLNAHARFACPLAVLRRLPFVINLSPKPEYARKDSPQMIDPMLLPPISDDWPDFWLISVEKVIDAGNGFAKHENVASFSDVNKFLDWLKETMEDFDRVQMKATLANRAMGNFKLCKSCNRVKCSCPKLQVEEGEDEEAYEPHVTEEITRLQRERKSHTLVESIAFNCAEAFVRYQSVRRVIDYSLTWSIPRNFALRILREVRTSNVPITRQALEMAGSAYERFYLSDRWKKVLSGLAVAATAAGAYFVYTSYTQVKNTPENVVEPPRELNTTKPPCFNCGRHFPKRAAPCSTCGYNSEIGETEFLEETLGEEVEADDEVEEVEEAEVAETAYALQGARQSVPDSHFAKTEKENVWKRDDYEVCRFDMTPLNVAYAKLPTEQLTRLVRRNVARMRVSNGTKVREGNAFCVGGHLWVTNSHSVFEEGDLNMSLSVVAFVEGTSPNVSFVIRQSEMYRDKERDLVWFQVFCWETKRDLRQLIAKPTLNIRTRGCLVGYAKDLSHVTKRAEAIVRSEEETPCGPWKMKGWSAWSEEPTIVGDCGMPLLTLGDPCAAIVGIHLMASGGRTFATALDTDIVEDAVAHFGRPILQCRVPEISAPSKKKQLTGLRPWSPLRWVEEGSLNVYGSFDDFQPTPRSKVTKTLLSNIIVRERGWQIDAAAPKLKDWRPWRHALVDIVGQKYGSVDTTKLQECAKAFRDDILGGLSKEQLSTVQVLSDKATINGIPGVKFIDKMNFKSSIGEPYRKSKKHFLVGPIGDKMFCPEVQERVNKLIAGYTEGICAAPIFSGQLKDEVRTHAKVEAGKVRVFLGGAGDWCFVARKYLLTTVKLIQENPFLFEASPGCAAQSAEWEQYYDYLTQFGRERLVAGDYGKFDKRMEATLILMAFWLIIEIAKAAGWSDEECLPMWCIAEDTAYAFCNFGGDLVQFFGSNPSGHPLTVIINCFVNSLYMRYCFIELDPSSDSDYDKARRFKKFVALLTYGDDNTMGVSKEAEWFNHTAIQRVLESIGVEYTMADKESESRPFIDITEVSYLKRRWRWDEDIGAVVCPLEEASIHKMLTYCLPSGEESAQFHMASVMVSAANEWFWYGKARFESERAWMIDLATRSGILRELEFKKMPTWDELYARYWKASEGIETMRSKGCATIHPRDVVA